MPFDEVRRKDRPLDERLMLQGPMRFLGSDTAASSLPGLPCESEAGCAAALMAGPAQAEREGWTGGGGRDDGEVERGGEVMPDVCEAGERCGGDRIPSAARGALGPTGMLPWPVWIRMGVWAAATAWASCCNHWSRTRRLTCSTSALPSGTGIFIMMWSIEWVPPRALVEGKLSHAAQRSLSGRKASLFSMGRQAALKSMANEPGWADGAVKSRANDVLQAAVG